MKSGLAARLSFVTIAAAALAASTPAAAAQPSQPAASMSTVRHVHTAVPLPGGRVFVAGGYGAAAERAEIYDPATAAWTLTAPSLVRHEWPVVARLCDGRVFVGGWTGANPRDAEIYDPATDTWQSAGIMKWGHIYGTATLLSDCRVLLTGGYSANFRAETFDPATGQYLSAGTMVDSRFFHTATLLPDGRVLAAAGGVDDGQSGVQTWYTYFTADLFDPAANKWTQAASLKRRRRSHTATLLPDGRVLVTGGTFGGKNDGIDGGQQLSTAEVYDPLADTWELLGAQLVTPRSFHTAHILPNGAVALFGGLDVTGSASRQVEAFYQGVFQPLDPLLSDRLHHASAPLPDGRILIAGGVAQATAELYSLAPLGAPCASPLSCASGSCVEGASGGLCCDQACDTGCRRCDVPGAEGTCARPCAGAEHALVCPDGGDACPNNTCIQEPCAPFLCQPESASCLTACTSVEQCAPGYACAADGQCVPPPDVSSADPESCALTRPHDRGPASALTLAALAALAAALRRRRASS